MGRNRDIHPSRKALEMRARRGVASPPPGEELGSPEPDDAPEVSSSAPMGEAVRLKAVYDARKSRLAAEFEQIRIDAERGRLLTREKVMARDAARDEIVLGRLSELTDACVRLMPLELQSTVKSKVAEVLAEFRRSVAEALKTQSK